jgi:hypothetical protein
MNVFEMKVHPAAEVFPMLSEDELSELADDIKANGLLQPIVIKGDLLVDGRNRREACRRAGVEPRVEELNGTDPVAYILATNVNRRHLTKGQRAMAVAKLYPESPEKGGRGKTTVLNTVVSGNYVTHARTVLRWMPEIADMVMAGTKPLNEAYTEAQRLKEQADSEPARLARLRERAPDLADLVDEGRMRLTEAESAYLTREEDVRRERQAILNVIDGFERMVDEFSDGKRRAHLVAHLQPEDRKRARATLTQWIKNLTATVEALQ